MAGHGGGVIVRVVVFPLPSGTLTGIGLRVMLGLTVSLEVCWVLVISMFEYVMELTVMGGMVTVILVVVLMNAVTSLPLTVVLPMAPYSNEVVYSPMLMVVAEDKELGGNTRMHGGSHLTCGVCQTLGSRYTAVADLTVVLPLKRRISICRLVLGERGLFTYRLTVPIIIVITATTRTIWPAAIMPEVQSSGVRVDRNIVCTAIASHLQSSQTQIQENMKQA